jgi:hypothetical protein
VTIFKEISRYFFTRSFIASNFERMRQQRFSVAKATGEDVTADVGCRVRLRQSQQLTPFVVNFYSAKVEKETPHRTRSWRRRTSGPRS